MERPQPPPGFSSASSRPSSSGRSLTAPDPATASSGQLRLWSGRRYYTSAYEDAVAPSRPQSASSSLTQASKVPGSSHSGGHGFGTGGTFAAALHPPDLPPAATSSGQQQNCPFSNGVLQEFSSALSSQGLTLRVLTLDSTFLGDANLELLCRGIRMCSNLKRLSLAFCCLTVRGMIALADALTPNRAHAKIAPQPEVDLLSLRGNPLGPAGLEVVNAIVARLPSLEYINLADIGVGEEDLPVLQLLGESAAANSTLTGMDLDNNYIGCAGALVFKRLLEVRPNISRLKLVHRLPRPLAMEITQLLATNFPKKGKKGGKKGKKKK